MRVPPSSGQIVVIVGFVVVDVVVVGVDRGKYGGRNGAQVGFETQD